MKHILAVQPRGFPRSVLLDKGSAGSRGGGRKNQAKNQIYIPDRKNSINSLGKSDKKNYKETKHLDGRAMQRSRGSFLDKQNARSLEYDKTT